MSNVSTPAIVLSADDKSAQALVSTIRAAVRGGSRYVTYVTDHAVTSETVADHARALAVLAFPTAEPVQKKDGARTVFGNAVQAAGQGLRRALADLAGDDDESTEEKPVNLLTQAGLAASLEEVTAAWRAAQQ